jgi:hypothetical protein
LDFGLDERNKVESDSFTRFSWIHRRIAFALPNARRSPAISDSSTQSVRSSCPLASLSVLSLFQSRDERRRSFRSTPAGCSDICWRIPRSRPSYCLQCGAIDAVRHADVERTGVAADDVDEILMILHDGCHPERSEGSPDRLVIHNVGARHSHDNHGTL